MCQPIVSNINNNQKIDGVSSSSSATASTPTRAVTVSSPPKDKYKNGVDRCKLQIEIGLASLAVIYGTVYWLNPPIQAAAKYCDAAGTSTDDSANGACFRPDLLAYKVTSGLSMLVMGCMGTYHWYTSRLLRVQSTSVPEERLFGYVAMAEIQNVVILCYQIWDFVVSLTIPEHFEYIFLMHHFLAGCIAYWSLHHTLFGYYSIYFGGCSEFSSIFLVLADMNELFPKVPNVALLPNLQQHYDTLVVVCQGLFVLTFTYYRVIGWIRCSMPLWKDTLHVIESKTVQEHRPNTRWLLYTFLGINGLLTVLQLFWMYQIVEKVIAR